jgi:protein TonB
LQLAIASPSKPTGPPAPYLVSPENISITEPEIDIVDDGIAASAAAPDFSGQILPPRPLPGHLNLPPAMPPAVKKLISNAAVVLRLLIEPDGSVSDAKVIKGSSNRDIDQITISFIEANWHFTPALQGGKPVEDSMTIVVHLDV